MATDKPSINAQAAAAICNISIRGQSSLRQIGKPQSQPTRSRGEDPVHPEPCHGDYVPIRLSFLGCEKPGISQPKHRVDRSPMHSSNAQSQLGNQQQCRRPAVHGGATRARQDDADDKFVPGKKRRKISAPRLARDTQQTLASQSELKTTRPRRGRARSIHNRSLPSKRRSEHAAVANSEGWTLPNPVLKWVRDGGTATFQFQFTGAISCVSHASGREA